MISQPTGTPPTSTWVLVWLAGCIAALVIGVLLTMPAWRRRSGAQLAAGVLTVQTGAAAVVGAVLTGVAFRSGQLVDEPREEHATSLVRLSRIDGDASFLLRMALLLAALTLFATVLSAACARLAARAEWPGRSMAAGLLTIEVGMAGYLGLRLLLGDRGLPYLGGLLAVPLLLAALITCLPRPHHV